MSSAKLSIPKTLPAIPLARKDGNHIPTPNVSRKITSKAKDVKIEFATRRRSTRSRHTPKRFMDLVIDSGNTRVGKSRTSVKGRITSSEVPQRGIPVPESHWNPDGSWREPPVYDWKQHKPQVKVKAQPIHPRLKAHIRAGTATDALRRWYKDLEPDAKAFPINGTFFDENPLPPARRKPRRLFPRSWDDARIERITKQAIKIDRKLKAAAKVAREQDLHLDEKTDSISEVRDRPIKTIKKALPRITEDTGKYEEEIRGILGRLGDFNYLQEESFQIRPSIPLVIPDQIKAVLVDDWENVTKSNQLVPLPHKKSVDQILNDWLEFEKPKRAVGSAQADILEEIVAGLKEYFERCLGRILLYRFERQQYTDFRQLWEDESSEQKCASDTYGAEHLCRLLVTLPELIAQTNMDNQSINRLREELSKLTHWICKNFKDYFVAEYETPGAEYIDKARNQN